MLVPAKPGKIKHAESQPSAWLQVFQAEMKSLFAGTKNGTITIDDALAIAFKILLDRVEAFPNDRDIIVVRIWLDLVALNRCGGGAFGVTELAPQNDGSGREAIISKCILPNGIVVPYPKVKWWRQVVTHVPPTIGCVFDYLVEARQRNICLIRGAPANLKRKLTRRWKAYVTHRGEDRGDHGFVDAPTRLLFLDVDGIAVKWIEDPEGSVKAIVGMLGKPWRDTSCVWFFSGTHGLEIENMHWTGKLRDSHVRVRLAFITTRALNEAEAVALTRAALLRLPALDESISRCVQPNYIRRPLWQLHPELDVLGNIPTIGLLRAREEFLTVPDDLTAKARWAKAQGHRSEIADHPNVESAILGIASDGKIRAHLKSAVVHLLHANLSTKVTEFASHAMNVTDKLRELIEQHWNAIDANLQNCGRDWGELWQYFPQNMADWALWLLEHRVQRGRKKIRLVTVATHSDAQSLHASCQRVKDDVHSERERALAWLASMGECDE